MKTRTIVDSWTTHSFGCIEVRMQKQLLGDDDSIISSNPHRTAIDPDTDIDAQGAAIQAHLSKMGFPLDVVGWERVKQYALDVRKTPEAQAWIKAKNEALAAAAAAALAAAK